MTPLAHALIAYALFVAAFAVGASVVAVSVRGMVRGWRRSDG